MDVYVWLLPLSVLLRVIQVVRSISTSFLVKAGSSSASGVRVPQLADTGLQPGAVTGSAAVSVCAHVVVWTDVFRLPVWIPRSGVAGLGSQV